MAVELLLGVGVAAGIGYGATIGVGALRDTLEREAAAASLRQVKVAHLEAGVAGVIRPIEFVQETPRGAERYDLFQGVRDDLLLAPLRDSAVKKVKFNRGGSSISLRIEFENGARAAFKPRQTNFQTIPRREVAAFRVNRMLGLASVAPAIGRSFRLDELLAAVPRGNGIGSARLRAEALTDSHGRVAGELSWWIPVITQAKVNGFRIDGVNGIVTWKRYLTVGRTIPRRDYQMVAQISNMVLFDHLINNSDRWTGGNARASDNGELLYFMDNTLAFGISEDGHERTRIYLRRAQRFSRRLVDHLRELTADDVARVLADDKGPFENLLTEAEIKSMLQRRDFSLAYIDELIERHGEDAVLVFP